jgi:hypothetical protein
MGSHQDTDDRIDPNLAALAAALGELYARPIIRGDSPEAKRLIRSFILANRELVTLAIDTVLGMNADERARLFRDHEDVLHPPGGAFPEYVSNAVRWAESEPGETLLDFDDDQVNVLSRVVRYAQYVADASALPPPSRISLDP